jgi:hypothetical protein
MVKGVEILGVQNDQSRADSALLFSGSQSLGEVEQWARRRFQLGVLSKECFEPSCGLSRDIESVLLGSVGKTHLERDTQTQRSFQRRL